MGAYPNDYSNAKIKMLSSAWQDIYEYSILRGWIKSAARSIFAIQHTFWGHMTNIAHLGSHMISIQHWGVT